MKKWILCLILIGLCSSINAQVFLEPLVTGTVTRNRFVRKTYWHFLGGSTVTLYNSSINDAFRLDDPEIIVDYVARHETSTYWHVSSALQYQRHYLDSRQGILEFNITQTMNGKDFPLPQMTTSNWTAQLIELHSAYPSSTLVRLYDLRDESEDGMLSETDFDAKSTFLIEGSNFDSLDVTELLRQDLFGSNTSTQTSGILCDFVNGFKQFDDIVPRIVLTGNWPTPTPTPVPIPDFHVDLDLSRSRFQHNDPFVLQMNIVNSSDHLFGNQGVLLMLEVFNDYYFYPRWGHELGYLVADIDKGITSYPILSFVWPETSGNAAGVKFYGAIIEPGELTLNSNLDVIEFGWGE